MNISLPVRLAALATAAASTFSLVPSAVASTFGQQEVDQNKFVAISVPRVGGSPQLVVLEQISDSQKCWKESGASPVTVEALLLNFDFTGICGRSTDTNGYSIRMAGQDLGLLYKLKIIKNNTEFMLVGVSNTDPNAPAIEIGKTHGIGSGLTKIDLKPGWRFSKRTYDGKAVGHIYLTSDVTAPGSVSQQQRSGNTSTRLNESKDNSLHEGL